MWPIIAVPSRSPLYRRESSGCGTGINQLVRVNEGKREESDEPCPAPQDAGQVGEKLQVPNAVILRIEERATGG